MSDADVLPDLLRRAGVAVAVVQGLDAYAVIAQDGQDCYHVTVPA